MQSPYNRWKKTGVFSLIFTLILNLSNPLLFADSQPSYTVSPTGEAIPSTPIDQIQTTDVQMPVQDDPYPVSSPISRSNDPNIAIINQDATGKAQPTLISLKELPNGSKYVFLDVPYYGTLNSTIVGDFNNDGTVGASDLATLATNFTNPDYRELFDLNRNGTTNFLDLAHFSPFFGKSSNQFLFTPASNFMDSKMDSFTYKIVDMNGIESAPITLDIKMVGYLHLNERVVSPVASNVRAMNITENAASFYWETNTETKTQIEYGTAEHFINNPSLSTIDNALVRSHGVRVLDLEPNTTYYYSVIYVDENGNKIYPEKDWSGNRIIQQFTTESAKDLGHAPFIPIGAAPIVVADTTPPQVLEHSRNGFTINWKTDEEAWSQVLIGKVAGTFERGITLDTLTKNHSIDLTPLGLEPDTIYYYQINSMDVSQNLVPFPPWSQSDTLWFKTPPAGTGAVIPEPDPIIPEVIPDPAIPDPVIPDPVVSDPVVPDPIIPIQDTVAPKVLHYSMENLSSTAIRINWTTDKAAWTQLLVGTTVGTYDSGRTLDAPATTSHSIELTGLQPDTVYYYQINSKDPVTMKLESFPSWQDADKFWFRTLPIATGGTLPEPDPIIPEVIPDPVIPDPVVYIKPVINVDTTERWINKNQMTNEDGGAINNDLKVTYFVDGVEKHKIFYNLPEARQLLSITEVNGDKETTVEWYVKVDRTSPVITSAYPGNVITVNTKNPTVTFNVEGGVARSITFENLNERDNVRPIQITDEAGNESNVLTLTIIVDTTAPAVSNVVATPLSPTSMRITWGTNESAWSQVLFGTTSGNYGPGVTLGNLVTSHSITLTDLKPDTIYYYQVNSMDPKNNLIPSQEFSFRTPQIPTFDPLGDSRTVGINIPSGYNVHHQLTIPKYGDGVQNPAGHLVGWGPTSVVAGSSKTFMNGALIVGDESQPLFNPFLSDFTFAGYNNTVSAVWHSDMHGLEYYDTGGSYTHDGISLTSTGGVYENLFGFFLDTAFRLGQSPVNGVDQANVLHNISANRVNVGIEFTGGKFDVTGLVFENTTDTAIKVLGNSEVVMRNVHTFTNSQYGMEVGTGAYVYVDGGYFEQSPIGTLLRGNGSVLNNLTSKENNVAVVQVLGQSNVIQNSVISVGCHPGVANCQANGLLIGDGSNGSGYGTVVQGVNFNLASNTVGIRLNADGVKIDQSSFGGYISSGETGILMEKAVNNSYIKIDCNYVNTGSCINFQNMLGSNNEIHVNITGYEANTISNWQTFLTNLPTNIHSSNHIYLNGQLIAGTSVDSTVGTHPFIDPDMPDFETGDPIGIIIPPDSGTPLGTLLIPSGTTYTSDGDYVLIRNASGQTVNSDYSPFAGQIVGEGIDSSVITATNVNQAIVVTPDFGMDMDEAQNGSFNCTTCVDAVLTPTVKYVTVRGAGVDNPFLNNLNGADQYGGIWLQANAAQVSDVKIENIPGVALILARTVTAQIGQPQLTDQPLGSAHDLIIEDVYKGITLGVDNKLWNVVIKNARDWGVYLMGAAAFVNNIDISGNGKQGIVFTGGPSWASDIKTADTLVGASFEHNDFGGANGSVLSNLVSKDHPDANVRIGVQNINVNDFTMEVMSGATGFDILSDRSDIKNGTILLKDGSANDPTIGLNLGTNTSPNVSDVKVMGTDGGNQVGIKVNGSLYNANLEITLDTKLEMGIDLVGSATPSQHQQNYGVIGQGNTLNFTVVDHTGRMLDMNNAADRAEIKRLINLPNGWDTTNKIFVNDTLIIPSLYWDVHLNTTMYWDDTNKIFYSWRTPMDTKRAPEEYYLYIGAKKTSILL